MKYLGTKTDNLDIATKTDLPTVNNPTITFTQGGTTKGSITLNQSSNQTIALDAGGSGGASPYFVTCGYNPLTGAISSLVIDRTALVTARTSNNIIGVKVTISLTSQVITMYNSVYDSSDDSYDFFTMAVMDLGQGDYVTYVWVKIHSNDTVSVEFISVCPAE